MGESYDAICKECGTSLAVSDGSGMIAMPFHCDLCGKEWWWEFGPGGPMGKEAAPPRCDCGGRFTVDALARCPECRSTKFDRDPNGMTVMYD
jgi:predicted Zn-ribbon and HTH transcriptional regulator